MSSHAYAFTTLWRVRSTCEEISTVLGDAEDLVRWWPAVYLDVHKEGEVVHLHTRGWLPYTLRWSFVTTGRRDPHGFSLRAWGDFVGEGHWTFTQQGEEVEIRYDWTITVHKPLIRALSWLLKPVFSMNHRWAMAQGEVSLVRELARRRARLPDYGTGTTSSVPNAAWRRDLPPPSPMGLNAGPTGSTST